MKKKVTSAGICALIAVIYFAAWGVPSFIDNRVSVGVQAEIVRIKEISGTPEQITQLLTRMDAVDARIDRLDSTGVRIEGKIDDLSVLFVGYLERKAAGQ